jgi:glycosyltransferase involved in cell wall biosynthesis
MQRTHAHDSRAPIVSTITPAFNTAPFVRHTLDSVLAQTFTDVEVRVVDDGSTDAEPQQLNL